jgi:thiamine kinase-like enzyme
MRQDELEFAAARHVPGNGHVSIQHLSTGLVNETYRVVRDGRAFALRITAPDNLDVGLDRAWEARVLECAGAAGLAPALEYCDPQRGLLIMRWVEGRTWDASAVQRPSNLARVAALMSAIHGLPIPAPARLATPATWIDRYSARQDSSEGLRKVAELHLAELDALPCPGPVLCHSDLHVLNLIDRGSSLVLLDWEYAHAADPLWDLAGWSANNDFSEKQSHDLLARYARCSPTPTESLRLRLLMWLYDYVCLLWCGLRAHGTEQGGAGPRARLLEARLVQRQVVAPIKFRHTTRPGRIP